MTKAVGLLSGGLDSTLAAKLLLDQGIEVHAVNFITPFSCTPEHNGLSAVEKAVAQIGNIPLERITLGDEFLEMIKNPRHGYGRAINPCIDCRIMKIRKAAEYMHEIGASFLFTGEVLGQRPMSQHRRALAMIDKDSGVAGLILRPLSAAHMEPTIPEQQGLVDRSKLLGIQGRCRKDQMALADSYGIKDYPNPAGGCILTEEHFADKLTDYFDHCDKPRAQDIPLLKIGRHFRNAAGKKTIVARDEREGLMIERLAPNKMNLFYPVNFSGPHILSEQAFGDEIREMFYKYSKILPTQENRIEWVREGTKSECAI